NEPITLVVDEEECLVLLDRAPERSPVKVANVRILRRNVSGQWVDLVIEKVARSKSVPAAKIERITMKIISPTARDHINNCAVIAPVLGREVIGKDAKFLG